MSDVRAPRQGESSPTGIRGSSPSAPPSRSALSLQALRPRGSTILMYFAFALIVVQLGRPFDFVLTRMRLPGAICGLALLAAVVGGGLHILKTRVGLPLLALVGWMALVTPFSSWKGGSTFYLLRYAFIMFSFLLPVASAPKSIRDVRKLFIVAAIVPMILLLLTTTIAGTFREVALGLEDSTRMRMEGGTYANSADVALVAGFTVPFMLFICSQFQFRLLQIPLGAVAIVFLARAALLSGTRAALLAGAGMFTVYFVLGRLSRRALLLVIAAAAIVIVPQFLPGHIATRLGTLLDSFYTVTTGNMSTEAMQSAAQRRELLMDSLRYTFRFPLTGVGPGQFSDYRWRQGVEEGVRKPYLVAHNTFTQVSSECGIPGFIFFVAMLVGIYRTLKAVKGLNSPDSHPDWRMAMSMRTCLVAGLVYYAICGVFMSLPMYVHPVLLGSLALALERTSRLAMEQARLKREVSTPETASSSASDAPAWKRGTASATARSRSRFASY